MHKLKARLKFTADRSSDQATEQPSEICPPNAMTRSLLSHSRVKNITATNHDYQEYKKPQYVIYTKYI